MSEPALEQHGRAGARRVPADSPEPARLCAADNLSLDNLAAKSWEPVALFEPLGPEKRGACGNGPVVPEASAGEGWGMRRGVPEAAEAYRGSQKNSEVRKRAVCPYALWLVPKVNNDALCCKSWF